MSLPFNKGRIPDFNFMVMNFEDFVAMHFADDVFEVWKNEMDNAGHFSIPLHSDDYAPIFEKIWQQNLSSVCSHVKVAYTKGSLPDDFVTIESLKNMIRHCDDDKLKQLFKTYAPAGALPQFLSDRLKEAYPEIFG